MNSRNSVPTLALDAALLVAQGNDGALLELLVSAMVEFEVNECRLPDIDGNSVVNGFMMLYAALRTLQGDIDKIYE